MISFICIDLKKKQKHPYMYTLLGEGQTETLRYVQKLDFIVLTQQIWFIFNIMSTKLAATAKCK